MKKFVVHKESACFYSPIFKAAFNSTFIEGQTQEYRLDDVNEGTVQFLVQWIYRQEMSIVQLQSGKHDPQECQDLVETWVLADRLLVPGLQNAVLAALDKVQTCTGTRNIRTIPYVYENTSPGSQLRRYVVASCAAHLDVDCYSTKPKYFPKEMLLDLIDLWATVIPEEERDELSPSLDLTVFYVPDE